MAKKISLFLSIAAVHFVATNWLLPVAMQAATGGGSILQPSRLIVQVIVLMSKILHFPVISANLYSRDWVPGNWIYIPLLINSFLWAAGICLVVKLIQAVRKAGHSRRSG